MRFKELIVLFTFINYSNHNFAQSCIDSIAFSKYNNVNYNTTNTEDNNLNSLNLYKDNIGSYYIEGVPIDKIFYSSILTKFNSANQPIWSKYYKRENASAALQAVGGWPHAIDTFTNIYGNRYYRTGMASPIHYQAITKFDSSGNFIWGKLLNRRANPTENWGLFCNNTITRAGTQFYYTSSAGQNYMTSIGVNNGGSIVYNQRYNPVPTNIRSIIPYYNALLNDSTLLLFFQLTTTTNLRYYKLMKINVNNNTILLQKTLVYYQNNGQKTNTNYKCFFNHKTQKLTIVSFSFNTPSSQSYFISTFNINFENIKTASFRRSGSSSIPNFEIFKNDNIIFNFKHSVPIFSNPSYKVFQIIDSNLNQISARRIELSSIGFPNFGAGFTAYVNPNYSGYLNFIYTTGTSAFTSTIGDIYMMSNNPFINKNTPCTGRDTTFFTKEPVELREETDIPFTVQPGIELDETPLDPPTYETKNFTKTEYCKEVSICDAIQLQPLTPAQKCLSQPLDSFKVIRSPLCLRKTQWLVDTTAMQILNSNNTMLYVKYLRSYTGNVTVTYGGCNLSSSTPISVSTPKTGVFIGNDTTLCPAGAIPLNAGTGFKTYAWSTGFGVPSITITQAGKYWVTAIDSCNNQFTDTINISPITATLQVTFTDTICQYDTAFIQLPTNLYNYSWQPSTFSYLKGNNVLSLYPKTNTIYTIKANAAKDCILTDTVLIRTKNCPQNIYFPTAFTPNGDGLNDEYKPSLIGNVVYYEFTIFNRWGQKIFSTKTPNKGWNGKINNGQPLMGSYVYTCRYKFFTKKEEVENGTFVLIR